MPSIRTLSWTLILLAGAMPAVGGVELVLIDGRILQGIDVQRDGGEYALSLEGGYEIMLPVELVEQVRLTGVVEKPTPGIVVAGPRDLARSAPEGPGGLRDSEPQTLAGRRIRAPATSEQLEVLGPRAGFQKSITDNRWTPSTDWDWDPQQNDFNPSTWADGTIDSSWTPSSAWGAGDALAKSRSTWKKSAIETSWTPTDGFETSLGRR